MASNLTLLLWLCRGLLVRETTDLTIALAVTRQQLGVSDDMRLVA
jgi:hypothetical protein